MGIFENTSWIISKIVKNYGGLHNRLTRQISLEPFSLHECELFAKSKNLGMSRRNILETYMVLGGIPYYWNFLEKGESQAQSIDRLFFSKKGELRNEYGALYASLFKNPEPYIEVVAALGHKKAGMTRKEIIDAIQKNEGGKLTSIRPLGRSNQKNKKTIQNAPHATESVRGIFIMHYELCIMNYALCIVCTRPSPRS